MPGAGGSAAETYTARGSSSAGSSAAFFVWSERMDKPWYGADPQGPGSSTWVPSGAGRYRITESYRRHAQRRPAPRHPDAILQGRQTLLSWASLLGWRCESISAESRMSEAADVVMQARGGLSRTLSRHPRPWSRGRAGGMLAPTTGVEAREPSGRCRSRLIRNVDSLVCVGNQAVMVIWASSPRVE